LKGEKRGGGPFSEARKNKGEVLDQLGSKKTELNMLDGAKKKAVT